MSAARPTPPTALPLAEPARSVIAALPPEPFDSVQQQRGLHRLLQARQEALRGGRRPWRWALAGGGLVAACLAAVLLLTRAPAPALEPGALPLASGELKAAPSAEVEVDRDRVRVDSGELSGSVWRSEAADPVRVATPHLRLRATRARWTVRVNEGQTELVVLEGKVAVEQAGGLLFVEAGQTFLAPARKAQDCEAQPDPARRARCLEPLAAGEGLAAEGALYSLAITRRDALGSAEGALQALSEHRRRFPEGSFAPEVTEAAVSLLLERGDGPQALRWLEGTGARTDRLSFLQAQALGATGRLEEADALLLSLAERGAIPELREEALFLSARLAVEHGPAPRAHARLTRYRALYPAGLHAREVEQWLAR